MTDDEIRNSVRQRIIQCRKEKGATQHEVGIYCGKSDNAVSSWEQGLSLPDIATLVKLARFYNKSIAYMYGMEDEPQNQPRYDENKESLTNGVNPKQADSAIVDMLIEKLVNSEVEKKLAENMLKIEKLKNKKTLGD